jgi:hypothetical protein
MKDTAMSKSELRLIRNACLVAFMVLFSNESASQFSPDNISISWGVEHFDPVKVEVEETNEPFNQSVRFIARNTTYYQFLLKIVFRNVTNLAPRPSTKEMMLKHGTNQVINLVVATKDAGYGYEYTASYELFSEEGAADLSWPYLVPLKPGTVPHAAVFKGKTWRGRFNVSPGDTIYCMRKGLVTALPESNKNEFRISSFNALEVLHADGTMMTYAPLICRSFVNSLGSIVLPGEPVGVATDSAFVWVNLVEFMPGNTLTYPPMRYATGESSAATFEGIIDKIETVHPVSVIAREKTKSELKKKGK